MHDQHVGELRRRWQAVLLPTHAAGTVDKCYEVPERPSQPLSVSLGTHGIDW